MASWIQMMQNLVGHTVCKKKSAKKQFSSNIKIQLQILFFCLSPSFPFFPSLSYCPQLTVSGRTERQGGWDWVERSREDGENEKKAIICANINPRILDGVHCSYNCYFSQKYICQGLLFWWGLAQNRLLFIADLNEPRTTPKTEEIVDRVVAANYGSRSAE